MADARGDARGGRRLPVAAGAACHSGRHLHRLSARRLLGSLGGRLGVHPAELFDRRRAWRAVRAFRRPERRQRHLLRRQSCRDRAHPPFELPARKAWHGGSPAMADRSRLFRRHGAAGSGGRHSVYSIGHSRPPLLWKAVQGWGRAIALALADAARFSLRLPPRRGRRRARSS